MPMLLGIFDYPSQVAAEVTKLRNRGFSELETYSPAPFEEVELAQDPRPSAVRLFTLIGGLTGVITGFGIQIWMSLDWPVKIAGKAFASIPPFFIIGFELTILFGGILTVLGMAIMAGLYPRKLDEAYSARFSAEEFGVSVVCDDRDVAEVESLLQVAAKEISIVDH
jgi:molybdopterin-containing oxidoreductase family membrane subunit